MLVSYNFKQIDHKEFQVSFSDRGFRYGDGLFETIIYQKNKIRFFKDHLKRLKNGMKALGIEGAEGIKKDLLEQQIVRLISKNKLHGRIKVRINVWRKSGGLYLPNNNHFNILITTEEQPNVYEFKAIKIAFSKEVNVSFSPFSRFKTTNALPYIIASIEKQKRGFDDVVICDSKKRVAECVASNIFWVKDKVIYTPSLKTGCIAGIARKNIIKKLTKAGVKVLEVAEKKEILLEADSIFLSNVNGIVHVQKLEDKTFEIYDLVDSIFS
ncbi:aminotransferase class IV [Chondrinema litorale]|uniref:aminotransferase class IV n=1 Tax=Chondrinema litorale TaxID=2994555 RepID=UPI0025431FF5|nr:aminotransferase class IV [Chondrinema litorale]UZR94487.1 aminotransferase class IV [Chondrinema litorale]